ncbi:MAG: hypothetical protein ABJO67_14040 [Pseudoruegeria sp.]
MKDTIADPQVQYRGMQTKLDRISGVCTPISFSDAELSLKNSYVQTRIRLT